MLHVRFNTQARSIFNSWTGCTWLWFAITLRGEACRGPLSCRSHSAKRERFGCESNKEEKTRHSSASFRHFCTWINHSRFSASVGSSWSEGLRGFSSTTHKKERPYKKKNTKHIFIIFFHSFHIFLMQMHVNPPHTHTHTHKHVHHLTS